MPARPAPASPAIAALVAAGVSHSVHSYRHDPAAPSFGHEAADALGLDAHVVFKTLLTEVDGASVCALVPVTASLSLKALAAAHGGKRAVMMDPSRAQRLTGYVIGGISPLGQRTASPTYIDSSALTHEHVWISGGRRGLEISIAPMDLIDVTHATVAPIATGLSARA
jgi:Cys-tRNA(Pro)/Cys-tRNA(Cys) deacylase